MTKKIDPELIEDHPMEITAAQFIENLLKMRRSIRKGKDAETKKLMQTTDELLEILVNGKID